MYKVIKFFTDLHDKDHPYNAGDIFPRDGVKVTGERLVELSGSENKREEPLIELVQEVQEGAAEKKEPVKKVSAKEATGGKTPDKK